MSFCKKLCLVVALASALVTGSCSDSGAGDEHPDSGVAPDAGDSSDSTTPGDASPDGADATGDAGVDVDADVDADADAPSPSGLGFPFGSHAFSYAPGTIWPSKVSQAEMDQKVRDIYADWKEKRLSQQCGPGRWVVKFGSGKLAVSEGQGYGMLITVAMAGHDPQAREIFDGLHLVARDHGSQMSPDLMSWVIDFDCNAPDPWPAADGDLDMALALLMADRQWGSSGAIDYMAEAKKTIAAIEAHLLSPSHYVKANSKVVRTSDMMTAHFKAFQKATGNPIWKSVDDASLTLLETVVANHSSSGLHPDFIQNFETSNPSPSPGGLIESATEGMYGWNACRNPWRFGTDFVMTGDPRTRALAKKIVAFYQSATGNDPNKVFNTRWLDGTIHPGSVPAPGGWDGNSLAFQAPLGVGAMVDASHQAFLDAMWQKLASVGTAGYYDQEIQLLSMLVISGNWWQP